MTTEQLQTAEQNRKEVQALKSHLRDIDQAIKPERAPREPWDLTNLSLQWYNDEKVSLLDEFLILKKAEIVDLYKKKVQDKILQLETEFANI